MGLCIDYCVKAKSEAAAAGIIEAAVAEAAKLGWKACRRKKADPVAAFSPHPKCEDVLLDFSAGLDAEGTVKTNFAPEEVHVAVVGFFDAIKAAGAAVRLDDETGYARSRSLKTLRDARAAFESAFDAAYGDGPAAGGEAPQFFTGLIVHADGRTEITDELKSRMSAAQLRKLEASIAATPRPGAKPKDAGPRKSPAKSGRR